MPDVLSQAELKEIGDRLYEQVAKPLEADHWGEFVAIAQDGRYVIGPDQEEVSRTVVEKFGKGVFVFKVDPRAVGRLDRPRRLASDASDDSRNSSGLGLGIPSEGSV